MFLSCRSRHKLTGTAVTEDVTFAVVLSESYLSFKSRGGSALAAECLKRRRTRSTRLTAHNKSHSLIPNPNLTMPNTHFTNEPCPPRAKQSSQPILPSPMANTAMLSALAIGSTSPAEWEMIRLLAKFSPRTFEAQTEQAIFNLKAVLEAACLSLDAIVGRKICMIDMEELRKVEAVWGSGVGTLKSLIQSVRMCRFLSWQRKGQGLSWRWLLSIGIRSTLAVDHQAVCRRSGSSGSLFALVEDL